VFSRRHQNLGIGKGERIVRLQQAVHVVAVVVRDQSASLQIPPSLQSVEAKSGKG
jgi:hypothetical protein